MTDPDFIDELFVERYPGSKTEIRSAAISAGRQENAARSAPHPLFDPETWGDPRVKTIAGRPTELYTVGSFARALGRQVVTIRKWERDGRIPVPPYRMPGRAGPRGDAGARRYYSQKSILSALEAFKEYGFLYAVRVDWASDDAKNMSLKIAEAWKQEIIEFNNTIANK